MATISTYLQLPVVDISVGATENALAITSGTVVARLQPTAVTCQINGITGGEDGRVLFLYLPPGASINTVQIAHENASATAANRIICRTAALHSINREGTASGFPIAAMVYDGAQSRWILTN